MMFNIVNKKIIILNGVGSLKKIWNWIMWNGRKKMKSEIMKNNEIRFLLRE